MQMNYNTKKGFLFLKNNNENYEDSFNILTADVGSADVEKTYSQLELVVNSYGVNTIIAKKEQVYYAARLLWNNDNVKRYVLINTDDAQINEKQNIEATKLMWDSLAKRNMGENDEIKLSGWIKSDTGEYFTRLEMNEFSNNLYQKIKDIIGEKNSVLEIGVASGISCFAVAPLVRKYYGVDLSQQVLSFTKRTLKENNIDNVTLINCEAIDIDNAGIPKVDLVLMNSVIQYFPGYNYFINVLKKSIDLVNHKGHIFLGDVLNLDLYDQYRVFRGLEGIKYNREQYYSKVFFEKLPGYFGEIKGVIVSEKIGQIKNELNTYRYDVLLEIDKDNINLKKHKKSRIAENLLFSDDNTSIIQIIEEIEKKYDFDK